MNALWDYITSHQSQLVFDSYQHVSAVIQSVIIATVIGVVIGLLTYSNDIASNLAPRSPAPFSPFRRLRCWDCSSPSSASA